MALLKILNASPGSSSPLDVMQLDQNTIPMLKHYEKRVSYCQLLLQKWRVGMLCIAEHQHDKQGNSCHRQFYLIDKS